MTGYTVTSLTKLRMLAPWRMQELHGTEHHRLYWITRGQGRVIVSCVSRGYGPNTAIWVPGRTMMALELPAQIQGLELVIPTGQDLDLPDGPRHLRISNIESQGNLTSAIERIEREIVGQAPAMERALRAYGLLISTGLERELARQDGRLGTKPAHRLAMAFSALLEGSYHQGFGVADFARELGVTPTHLSRVCRTAAGRPAHALIHERLMHEARLLLADTRMPARAVAERLGFSSAAYFTRAFAAYTGRTPSEFRRPGARRL
ncbi:helix-turn-helix domain-containing protein [Rhodobacterales bacterium HKCCE3408]|nr:helix-turn-helix domain-containing protein [Rhodobacterales bacterium HKCCE3408]